MSTTFRAFLDALDAAGELTRITEPTSPILTIAERAHLEARTPAPSTSRDAQRFDPDHARFGGRALLFQNVEGCDFPCAINTFGSYRRMELALGATFSAVGARLGELVKPEPPRSFGELIGAAKRYAPLLRTPPRTVRRGVCQEIVKLAERGEVDLSRLPLLKCWPHDGDPEALGIPMSADAAGTAAGDGRYITFAGMHTIHADDRDAAKPSSHNIGMYRAQLIDGTRLAMHWHMHHDGAAHWRSWKKLGKPMPIAICFGGEPILPYAATAPLPPGISELLMAGVLNGRGIPLVAAKTVPLRVPANSEIVIEGWVSTECGGIGWSPEGDEPLGPGAVFEGPFGDHTGYYSMPDRYPIVEVSAITHRRDAVMPATVVGQPPQEDYYLGKATERVFLPLLQTIVHDIRDYHLPRFGCFHNCAFVQIDKQYPLQARRVMHSIWGAGQMAWTKCIVVVDADVDVHDERAVLRALTRIRFDRDVECVHGPLDILDHAAPSVGAGGKIGFDATPRWRGESAHGVAFDAPITTPRHDVVRDATARLVGWKSIVAVDVPEWGNGRTVVLGVDKQIAGDGARALDALRELGIDGVDLGIAVDANVELGDYEDVWFTVLASLDPTRDLHRHGAFLGLDGTSKQPGDERNGMAVREWPIRLPR